MSHDEPTERARVFAAAIERIARGIDSPETADGAPRSDLIAPLGRSPFGEVDGVVFVGDAREPFASIARDAEFEPLAGADIVVLSGRPGRRPRPPARSRATGRPSQGRRPRQLTVTYDRSYTKQIHGPAHTH